MVAKSGNIFQINLILTIISPCSPPGCDKPGGPGGDWREYGQGQCQHSRWTVLQKKEWDNLFFLVKKISTLILDTHLGLLFFST